MKLSLIFVSESTPCGTASIHVET